MAQQRVDDTIGGTPDGTVSAASPNADCSSYQGRVVDSALGRRAGSSDDLQLPERYGIERITLMCQDPFTLYCYWELLPGSVCRCQPRLADGGKWVLNVQPDGRGPYDVAVAAEQGACYVNLEQGGGAYVVVLGVRTRSGELLPLLRSNMTMLPAPAVSAVEDESWSGGAEFDARAFAAAALLRPQRSRPSGGRTSAEQPDGPSSHVFGPRFHNWSSFLLAKKNST